MAKEHNFIHPDLTSFLFLYISCHFQCWLKNIKAKSFNVKIHHRQITNHLNNPILSHLYEVAEFILKFIQRLRPFISRTTINTANDKMTIKNQITGSVKVIYPKLTLMTFLYRYRWGEWVSATVTLWRKRNDRLTRMKTDLEIELNIQMPNAFPLPEEQYLLVSKIRKYRACNIKPTSKHWPRRTITQHLEAWGYFSQS